MTKINKNDNRFYWVYKIGFLVILALPILIISPYFFPADWGKTIVFRSILSILLFLCLWQFLFKGNQFNSKNFIKNKVVWALAALLAVYSLATIFSVDPLFSLWGSPYRGGGFIDFVFYFVFAVMAYMLFRKEDWKNAWIFSIFIGFLISLIGIIQYYGWFNRIFLSIPNRPPSTMGNPDLLAIYLLLLFFITISFAIKENKIWLKTLYIASLAIFVFTILITGSRATYLGLFVGGIYFLLAYPEKMKYVKITALGITILAVIVVFYANVINRYPQFLENNKLFHSIEPRLAVNTVLNDPRFAAWQIEIKSVLSRPILGYGPENLSIGFDKYYDSSIPYLNRDSGWYDKAHNILLQTVAEAGFLGIIAYLALFVVLFWQLQKKKAGGSDKVIFCAIQATLIGYLVNNFFLFDSFSTYIIFFLLIGYSLHLTAQNSQNKIQNQPEPKKAWWKPASIFVLFIILVIFLWQYNLLPLQINAEINKASDLVVQKQCDQALALMDKNLVQHSFLDSYASMEYVEYTKTCATFYPQNDLTYIKRDLELLNEAVKIQPFYTRYWLYKGAYESTLASQEQDTTQKSNLIKLANDDFSRALQLAPKHQEIYLDLANLQIISGDYKGAGDSSQKCIALNPAINSCYFYLGLSQIYLKDAANADKNLQTALKKGYDINSEDSLNKMANAYGYLADYQNLASVYEKLIAINPSNVQYHSSLAFIYAKLGEYDKARQEANKVLQLSPASKQNVEQFLNSLP